VPAHEPGVVTSKNEIATFMSHSSVAVATKKVGVAGQFTGVTCVAQTMFGGVTSITSIVLLHVALLSQSSVAVQVRVTL